MRYAIRIRPCFFGVGTVLMVFADQAAFGQTWVGNGATGNWSDATNWTAAPVSAKNTALIFSGTNQLKTVEDSPSGNPFLLNSITYKPNAGAFSIRPGNPLQFNPIATVQPQVINNSSMTQFITVPVQINNTTLNLTGSGNSIAGFLGVISDGVAGPGGIAVNCTGSYVLGGAAKNTYTGNTTLANGTLRVNGDQAFGPTGTLVLAGGTISAISGAVVGQTVNNPVILAANQAFGDTISANTLTFTSTVMLTANTTMTINKALTYFQGSFNDGGKKYTITVNGDAALDGQKELIGGRMKIGNSPNANLGGALAINKGGAVTLALDSVVPNANGITVAAGGFFGGNGSIQQGTGGKVVANGPGGKVTFAGAGYFKCPNDGALSIVGSDLSSTAVEFQSGSVFAEDIEGLDAGTGYTQMGVTNGYGDIDQGAILDINPEIQLSVGNQFEVMLRDESPPSISQNEFYDTNGNPLSEGDVFNEDGYQFQINYSATDSGSLTGGNDVLLTVISVPEPAAVCVLAFTTLGALARRRSAR